jgi:uncharacterized protein (DUF2267 family)
MERALERGAVVDYRTFVTTVEREAGITDDEEAGRAACLTLHTLARRISSGEAEDLAERLPEELRGCVAPDGPVERFDVDEFIRRIESELHADRSTAERTARGVLAALWAAVGADEFDDMRAQLPKDFGPLLDDAVAHAPRPTDSDTSMVAVRYDEFLDRVAQRTGLDREGAARAADAVLEVLAKRITAGQVEDLEPLLPPELRPAIRRGIHRTTHSKVRTMSVDEFVDWVAKLEGVDRATATQHARAVLKVVREAVGEKEWHDTVAQLPGEYRILLREG